MIELECDMWKEKADAHVITTNGDVNKAGEAVMGRGCAREAADRFDGLALSFGLYLNTASDSNHVHDLEWWGSTEVYKSKVVRGLPTRIVSFPVKHHWYERADLKLIERSAVELYDLTAKNGWNRVIVARPGCGNGQLQWKNVKPIIEPILDDRFVVVHRKFL